MFAGFVVSGTVASLAVNILAIFLFLLSLRVIVADGHWQVPLVMLFTAPLAGLLIAFAATAQSPADLLPIFGFLPFLLAPGLYATASKFSSTKYLIAFCVLALIGSLIASGMAIYDVVVLGKSRASGILTGEIVIARTATLFGFVAATAFFVIPGRWRLVFLAGPVAGIIVTALTQTRGVFIVLPVLLLALLAAWLVRSRMVKGKRIWLVLAAAVIAVLTAAMLFASNRFESLIEIGRVFTGGEGVIDNSTRIRLDFYTTAVDLFRQSWLTGYGWAHMGEVAIPILPEGRYPRNMEDFFHFHNDTLNLAVAAGLFGIAAWICWLAAPLVSAWRQTKGPLFSIRLYAAGVPVILYAISGLTDMTFGWDSPTTAYAYVSAALIGLMRDL